VVAKDEGVHEQRIEYQHQHTLLQNMAKQDCKQQERHEWTDQVVDDWRCRCVMILLRRLYQLMSTGTREAGLYIAFRDMMESYVWHKLHVTLRSLRWLHVFRLLRDVSLLPWSR
jgi:hypothetical protein